MYLRAIWSGALGGVALGSIIGNGLDITKKEGKRTIDMNWEKGLRESNTKQLVTNCLFYSLLMGAAALGASVAKTINEDKDILKYQVDYTVDVEQKKQEVSRSEGLQFLAGRIKSMDPSELNDKSFVYTDLEDNIKIKPNRLETYALYNSNDEDIKDMVIVDVADQCKKIKIDLHEDIDCAYTFQDIEDIKESLKDISSKFN